MRALGYSAWRRQTVASVEQAKRRLTAEEVLGLALALETNISSLLIPVPNEGRVRLPSGDDLDPLDITGLVFAGTRHPVEWQHEQPVFTERPDAPIGANWLQPQLEALGAEYEREDRS
jgi:hypothetical protein